MKLLSAILSSCLCFGAMAQKIESSKVPSAVMNAFEAKYKDAKNCKWEIENQNEYEAEFKMGKQEMSAYFDEQGNWLKTETEIKEDGVSAAAKSTISNHFAGYKVKETNIVESKKGKYYEMEMYNGGSQFEVLIAEDGTLLSKTRIEKKEKD